MNIYETSKHYVLKTAKGFDVYRNEATVAVRCARIGFSGEKGLRRAIEEIKRRESDGDDEYERRMAGIRAEVAASRKK